MDNTYNGYNALVYALAAEGIDCVRAERMSLHTTVGTGGSADFFVMPQSRTELVKSLEICRHLGICTYVVGRGSNILVSDAGYRGAVICTLKMRGIKREGEFVRAEAGVTLADLLKFFTGEGLSGGEFLTGIPGTVGGAAAMNAGCFGKSIADIICSVTIFDGEKITDLPGEKCLFGYRTSAFDGGGKIVISALFRTKTACFEQVSADCERYRKMRAGQPQGRSMGSTFKNGELPAALLADRAGLKGMRVGGAKISERHANFIINDGNASSADIACLIKTAKALVFERTGHRLEEEIITLGDF